MFFKNHVLGLSAKFLWVGLVLGLFFIVCKFVVLASKRNIYVTNLTWFCFFLLFGGTFAMLCKIYYSHKFCTFGLLSMILGLFLVKISLDFFFTKFARMIYNGFTKLKKGKPRYEQLQTNQKN